MQQAVIAALAIVAALAGADEKVKPSNEVTVTRGELTVTLKAPFTCPWDKEVTVTVTLKAALGGGGKAGMTYSVALKEADLFFDDTIGTKEVVGPDEPGPWEKAVDFTFVPKKFDIRRTLKLYFEVKRCVGGLPGLMSWTNRKNLLILKSE